MREIAIAALIATALPAEAAPKLWTLDKGHAHVGWEIGHMGLSATVGRFNRFDGSFLIDEDTPENSRITFTVAADSVDSNHGPRDAHLRHADYLDAATYPEISFASERVEMLTPTSGKLHGALTLRGATAPLTLDFRMVRDRTYPDFIPGYDEVRVVGFEAEAEVLRLDHGMDFIAFLDSPTGLSVTLDIHFDLVDCGAVSAENVPCTWDWPAEAGE
ncbi:MAG: YceI family protein [Pseudomonadota bacterium]